MKFSEIQKKKHMAMAIPV